MRCFVKGKAGFPARFPHLSTTVNTCAVPWVGEGEARVEKGAVVHERKAVFSLTFLKKVGKKMGETP